MFSKDKTAYIFLILTTLFWSGNFIVGKAASLFEIPPFTLNFYRWTFAWLILAPFTLKEIVAKKNYILENIKNLKFSNMYCFFEKISFKVKGAKINQAKNHL